MSTIYMLYLCIKYSIHVISKWVHAITKVIVTILLKKSRKIYNLLCNKKDQKPSVLQKYIHSLHVWTFWGKNYYEENMKMSIKLALKKNKLCINRNENVLRYTKMEGVYMSTLFHYHSWVEEASFPKAVLSSYLPKEPRLGRAEGGFSTIGPALYTFCLL